MLLSTTKGACFRVAGALAITFLGFLTAQVFAQAEEAVEAEPKIIKTHAFATQGEPKYGPDFKHFDYVNPDAPKGGEFVDWAIGTYDNFNRFAQRGDAPPDSDVMLYDSLMVPSEDEIGVYYPLIAESMEYPENYGWVMFNINPNARDTVGKPITAEDVAFSFNQFIEEGVPFVRKRYKNVIEAEVLSKHRVKFHFEKPSRDDVSGLVSLTIFPKHYWKDRNLAEPLEGPPVGTGPYRVGDYKMGQTLTYERVKDYWAKDLPSRKGTLNFDSVKYDFYRDTTVALEAFKAGQYDFRQENVAKQWSESYDVPAVKQGNIIKETLPHEIPQPTQGFIFNTERELFQDRRVRQALNYALDFQWMNQNLFYGLYKRTYSYFQNTPYMAEGEPSERELQILEPLREHLPQEVFGPVWEPNVTDASGNIRPALRDAMQLLKEAGWELKNRKLVHSETGQPFIFEFLLYSSTGERVALPYIRNLERLGIEVTTRQVDTSQYINRLREREFDMTFSAYDANPYPHPGMRVAWHSDYLDSTYNQAGVKDPAIDALIEGIIANQENEEMLTAYGYAFDRVARWNFYLVPLWHSDAFRIAYWNKFSRPEKRPKYSIGLSTWWFDETKAKSLKK